MRSRVQRLVGKMLAGIPLGPMYFAYHPDAHFIYSVHPEFDQLFRRFRRNNRTNNGGDLPRLWAMVLNVKKVLAEDVKGDFAELGVWRGNTAAVLAHYAVAHGRDIFMFDTYSGFDNRDLTGIDAEKLASFADTSVSLVMQTVGIDSPHCHYVRGRFPESVSDVHSQATFAVVSLDCDLYEPMKAALEFFYPRTSRGGILLLHDYSNEYWDGARKAIDEFCARESEFVVLVPDKSGSAFIRKSRNTPT